MNLKIKEIVSYLIFGVATTAVNFITYSLIQICFDFHSTLMITAANAIAWLVAVIFAFFVNKYFVFKSKSFELRIFLKEFFLFFGVRIISGVFDIFLPTALIYLGLNQALFSIEGFWAKAAASAIVIVSNYFFSKLFVFKNNKT